MTEKRFTLFDEAIIDNEKVADDGGKEIYWTVEYVQRVKLVELLNELHEENTEYKRELDNIYLLIGRGDWSGLVDLLIDDEKSKIK